MTEILELLKNEKVWLTHKEIQEKLNIETNLYSRLRTLLKINRNTFESKIRISKRPKGRAGKYINVYKYNSNYKEI